MGISKFIVVIVATLSLFAAPAFAEDSIRVGAILAVTGPASNLGAPEARTLEMLVEDINAKGGIIGKKVDLILKDTGGSPGESRLLCEATDRGR